MNWLDNRPRTSLPIDAHLEEILYLIRSNQVVICAGEPGCGKTTRVAQAVILELSETVVTMTQPRPTDCRSNGQRIASELGSQIGELVGCQLGDESFFFPSKTRIRLMIDLILVNKIAGNKKLPEGLIIIDEAHERSQSIDLLLGLIRLYLPQSPKTRLLVISATLQLKKFSDFFNQAPSISVKGKSYLGEEKIVYLLKYEHHTDCVIRTAKEIAHRFFYDSLLVRGEIVYKGSVIILLPGIPDIKAAQAALLKLVDQKKKKNIEVLEYHSLSSYKEQDEKIQKPAADNTLRFVCSTNSLLNPMMLPDTFGVIDSLEYKRKFVDFTGFEKLKKIPVSLDDTIRAKWLTGRTRSGFYCPISYKDPVTNKDNYANLKEWSEPAILRESLDTLALKLISMGLSIRTFSFLDEIPQQTLDQTIQRLKEFELIDENENLTALGKVFSLRHLGVHEEKMLHAAKQFDVCHEMIILLGCLNVESSFIYNLNPRRRWSPLDNDYVELIYAYRTFKAKQTELQDENQLRYWCERNQLYYDNLMACDSKMKILSQKWYQNNSDEFIKERSFDEASLMKALISGNLCSYAFQEGSRYRTSKDLFEVSPGSFCPRDAPLIMFGPLRKVNLLSGHTVDLMAQIAAPIKFEWLLEMHPKLVYKKEFGPYFYDPSLDQVCRKEGAFFRWLKLGERSISVSDDIAKEQFAYLLASRTKRILLDSDNKIIKPSIGNLEIDNILLKNQEIQIQADKLSFASRVKTRKVYNFEELKQHYLEKLNGASNFKEIADLNALVLPPLNIAPKYNPPSILPRYIPPRIKVTTIQNNQ